MWGGSSGPAWLCGSVNPRGRPLATGSREHALSPGSLLFPEMPSPWKAKCRQVDRPVSSTAILGGALPACLPEAQGLCWDNDRVSGHMSFLWENFLSHVDNTQFSCQTTVEAQGHLSQRPHLARQTHSWCLRTSAPLGGHWDWNERRGWQLWVVEGAKAWDGRDSTGLCSRSFVEGKQRTGPTGSVARRSLEEPEPAQELQAGGRGRALRLVQHCCRDSPPRCFL